MRRMASRRAAVTCSSRSSIAFCKAGGMIFSPFSSVGRLAPALSATGLSAPPRGLAAHAAPAGNASASPSMPAARRDLFVVLVLIRPVLALEGPILFVVTHEALELQSREHVGRVAPLAQVRDLDLELLLLA